MPISLFVSLIFFSRLLALFSFTPLVLDLIATLKTAPSTLQLSILTGSYGIAQAFFQYPFARLSDKISRIRVIQSLLLLFSFASFGAYFSSTPGLLIIFRTLQGVCALQALIHAYLADYYDPQGLKKIMLIIGLAVTAALLIGYSFPLIIQYQICQVRMPFLLSGFLSLLCFVQSFFLSTPSLIPIDGDAEKRQSPLPLQWKTFALNSLIHFSHSFLMMSIACQKYSSLSHAYLFLLLGALIMAMPGLSPKIGKEKTLQVVSIQLFLHILSFLFIKAAVFPYLLVLLNFSLLFIFEASVPSMLILENSSHQRGYLMGLNSTFQYMAMAAGAMIAPYVVFYGYSLAFYFALQLLLLTTLYFSKSLSVHREYNAVELL